MARNAYAQLTIFKLDGTFDGTDEVTYCEDQRNMDWDNDHKEVLLEIITKYYPYLLEDEEGCIIVCSNPPVEEANEGEGVEPICIVVQPSTT